MVNPFNVISTDKTCFLMVKNDLVTSGGLWWVVDAVFHFQLLADEQYTIYNVYPSKQNMS